MTFGKLRTHWNRFGEVDPLWAVLTVPDTKGGKWDADSFFRTGQDDVEKILATVRHIWPNWTPSGEALDFGCGVGRLTRALGPYFERCHGVDIATSMVDAAKRLAGPASNCVFYVNERPDLKLFPAGRFSFINSALVLQHIEPRYTKQYIKEFVRVLAPGGVAVFQLPSGPVASVEGATVPAARLKEYRADILKVSIEGVGVVFDRSAGTSAPLLEMHCGETMSLIVRIRNAGSVAWPSGGQDAQKYKIHVGNHWLDHAGKPVRFDDGRASLPRDVAPGEEVDVLLTTHALRSLGDHVLEIDMVQEHVTWFGRKGSQTVRFPVRLVPVREVQHSVQTAAAAEPVMEMHAIPELEVTALLEAAGAEVTYVHRDNLIVPGWCFCTYYVTRPV